MLANFIKSVFEKKSVIMIVIHYHYYFTHIVDFKYKSTLFILLNKIRGDYYFIFSETRSGIIFLFLDFFISRDILFNNSTSLKGFEI
jgi:hypothetical protein